MIHSEATRGVCVCECERVCVCVRDEGISITRRAPSLYLRVQAGGTEKELNYPGGSVWWRGLRSNNVTELRFILQ